MKNKGLGIIILIPVIFILIIFISNLLYNKYKSSVMDKLPGIGEEINDEFSQEPEKSVNYAPDFELTNLKGEKVTLSEFRDEKYVVINFWATWCGFCVEEMPLFQEMADEYRYKDVVFLMVNNTVENETKKLVKEFLRDKALLFDNVLLDTKSEAFMAYDVTGMPTTFFIKKNGEILGSALGSMDKKRLKNALETLVEDK